MIRLWTLGTIGLTDEQGHPVNAVAVQTKRFALLAYLALSPSPVWRRRDTILALFWPELDLAAGRHALRQALHFLRTHLGPGVLRTRGAEDIAAGPDLWCDAAVLERSGESREALTLYRGDFLTGFFVRGAAPEFERWLDEQRSSLRERARAGFTALAMESWQRGRARDAVDWARRATQLAPHDESASCLLAELLATTGDREAASREIESLTRRLQEDLGTEPSRAVETTRLRLQEGAGVADVTALPSSPGREKPGHRLRFALVASVLALTATLVHGFAPRVTSARPALADSLYEQGLATLEDRSDPRSAVAWFAAALRAEPSFALAAYYAGVTADQYDGTAADRWFERAGRLAPNANEHDRLVIEAALAFRRNLPATVPIAETLATRYPLDPLSHHMLASGRLWSGDFAGALEEFRREERIGTSPRGTMACAACDAAQGIILALHFMDSLPAAERLAREAVRRVPASSNAWATLGTIEEALDHLPEAAAADRRASETSPGQTGNPFVAADLGIRGGDFTGADRLLRDALKYSTADGRDYARWLLIISLRTQGRLREALTVAEAYRHAAPDSNGLAAVPEAQVLFELGRAQEAARLFDTVATSAPDLARRASGVAARQRCWALAHAAEAWAAAGDSGRVLALADTIETLAAGSLYGRDRHLPAHLRGLVWLLRRQPDSALASFKAAVFSSTIGYTRTNLALGHLLLAAHRPHEAAVVAAAALTESLDGSAYYATRTELEELEAESYEAAGESDSAAAAYRRVSVAWSQADPMFRRRLEAARTRLAGLESPLVRRMPS